MSKSLDPSGHPTQIIDMECSLVGGHDTQVTSLTSENKRDSFKASS
jgi:hypothetical protein